MANLRENRITVSFSEILKKRLEEEARTRGWNMSQLVREIVKEYFANKDEAK